MQTRAGRPATVRISKTKRHQQQQKSLQQGRHQNISNSEVVPSVGTPTRSGTLAKVRKPTASCKDPNETAAGPTAGVEGQTGIH
jgi:hypothetical protein